MNAKLMQLIAEDVDRENVKFGSCKIDLVFHDGRITKYLVATTKQKNTSWIYDSIQKGAINE